MPTRPYRLRRFLVTCALLLLAGTALAANDRGLFYRAQQGNADIYLLGSIHVGSDALYPLRPAIRDAFAQAGALVVEIDVTRIDPQAVATWMAQNGQYPPGESLQTHLRPATWQRLSKYLQSVGIEPDVVARQKPGLVIAMLAMRQLTDAGLSATLGIDQHFLALAKASDKPVLELETLQQQLALLTAMPDADRVIAQTLDDMGQMKSETDALFKAWQQGDTATLEPLVMKDLHGDDPASRAYIARLLTQRNQTMATRLIADAKKQPKLFVVVGAAHLLGKQGIPALLQAQGFHVEQL